MVRRPAHPLVAHLTRTRWRQAGCITLIAFLAAFGVTAEDEPTRRSVANAAELAQAITDMVQLITITNHINLAELNVGMPNAGVLQVPPLDNGKPDDLQWMAIYGNCTTDFPLASPKFPLHQEYFNVGMCAIAGSYLTTSEFPYYFDASNLTGRLMISNLYFYPGNKALSGTGIHASSGGVWIVNTVVANMPTGAIKMESADVFLMNSMLINNAQPDPSLGSGAAVTAPTLLPATKRVYIANSLITGNAPSAFTVTPGEQATLVAVGNTFFVNNTLAPRALTDPNCADICVDQSSGNVTVFTDGITVGNYSQTFPLGELTWEKARPSNSNTDWIVELYQNNVPNASVCLDPFNKADPATRDAILNGNTTINNITITHSGGLSAGETVAVVLGVLGCVAIVVAATWFFLTWYRRSQQRKAAEQGGKVPASATGPGAPESAYYVGMDGEKLTHASNGSNTSFATITPNYLPVGSGPPGSTPSSAPPSSFNSSKPFFAGAGSHASFASSAAAAAHSDGQAFNFGSGGTFGSGLPSKQNITSGSTPASSRLGVGHTHSGAVSSVYQRYTQDCGALDEAGEEEGGAMGRLERQLDGILEEGGLFLGGRYKLLEGVNERRRGGQGIVQFASLVSNSNLMFAIKFFLSKEEFDIEASYYCNDKYRSILPPPDYLESNENGRYCDPWNRPLPPFIVMEKGESLDSFITRSQRADLGNCIQIVMHVVERVAFIHAAGIVHRDIKPSNTLLLRSRNLWTLIDFGSAAPHGAVAPLSLTIGYAAPETVQAYLRADKQVVADFAVDVFAVGMMAFELFAHRRVFEGDTQTAIAMFNGDKPFPWEDTEGPNYAADIQSLGFMKSSILKMLHRDPAQRPALMDVHQRWQAILQSQTTRAAE